MDISKEQYKIVFTNDSIIEMDNIYNYISKNLKSFNSAKKLMKKIDNAIEHLKYMPKIHRIIKRSLNPKFEYRKIVINNYIIIYLVSENEKKVYIMHIYYCRSNYLNNI